jgi:hypothetical protein
VYLQIQIQQHLLRLRYRAHQQLVPLRKQEQQQQLLRTQRLQAMAAQPLQATRQHRPLAVLLEH